jgi:hypothetical protein
MAIQELKELALAENRAKYPNLPDYARTIHKYSDRTANGLTRCIIDWLRLNGHQAERISVTGRYIDKSKVVSDCVGNKRVLGSGQWIKPTMQVGTADISAIIRGRSVKIEVKIGTDRQSEAQKEYQKQVETAGGVYMVAKSFDDFIVLYRKIAQAGGLGFDEVKNNINNSRL